jgi:putative addiction module CopG family antidote
MVTCQQEDNEMTIRLPEYLERYVHEQVQAGFFPTEDEVIRDALERHRLAQRLSALAAPSEAAINAGPGSIGAMHEDAELIEQITQGIMRDRETRTLRPPPNE